MENNNENTNSGINITPGKPNKNYTKILEDNQPHALPEEQEIINNWVKAAKKNKLTQEDKNRIDAWVKEIKTNPHRGRNTDNKPRPTINRHPVWMAITGIFFPPFLLFAWPAYDKVITYEMEERYYEAQRAASSIRFTGVASLLLFLTFVLLILAVGNWAVNYALTILN